MILVTVDTSPESETALSVAADLARRFDEPLRLLMVLDGALRHHFHNLARETGEPFAATVAGYLDGAVGRVGAAAGEGLQVEGTSRHAVDASEGILEEVSESGPTLVVLATHGRSGVSRWLTGSVTESVIRSSPVPVVVVPAAASGA